MLPFFREPFRASSLCFSAYGIQRGKAKLGQQPSWPPYSYRNPDLIAAKGIAELIAKDMSSLFPKEGHCKGWMSCVPLPPRSPEAKTNAP